MNLMISHAEEAGSDACIGCGKQILATVGPRLRESLTGGAVCRVCGTREAPRLIALLDLARVAERAGRVCRHTLVPPLETLLDLARAAEEYNSRTPQVAASR